MKKIFTLTAVLIAGIMISTAQTQVPNGTFEGWASANAATSWSSVSLLGVNNCFQSTDAHGGTYAARLRTTDTVLFTQPILVPGLITLGVIDIMTQSVKGGIACTDKPDELRGWYKYIPVGGDTMNVIVYFWENNGGVVDTVGTGTLEVPTGAASYTSFSILIEWDSLYTGSPDSANIVLTNCGMDPHGGTVAIYDDLSFYYASTGLSVPLAELSGSAWPNPARDIITVPTLEGAAIRIYNLNGALMYSSIADSRQYSIDLSSFPRGLYLLQQSNEAGSYTSKLILE